ncbi:MAG: hypothetical protein HRT73_06560 [Flavobacteriales bacterium]|nr:hypothetical protein [Flavobacteriales bacterium]
MAKKNLSSSKADALLKDVLDVGDDDLGIENVVISSPEYMLIRQEKRNEKVNVYITKTEKTSFIKAIGRETESNVCRELMLYTLGLPTDKPHVRKLVLDLIKKNHA